MKKGLLKKIAMCFALVAAMCFAKGADVQAAEEVGTVVEVNEKVTGVLENAEDTEWYTFHIEERSVTEISFGVNSIVDKEKANDGWNIYFYNEEYELVRSCNNIVTQTDIIKMALGKGTYYVKIEASSTAFTSWAPVGCTYSLTVNNEVRSDWEIEKNQNKSQATSISANNKYRGLLHSASDEDWYKVKVTKKGYVRIAFGLAGMEDVDKVNDGWIVTLYDSSNNKIQSYSYESNAETIKLPVATGTYYVKVAAASTAFTSWAPVDCEYVLTVKNTQSSVWESERNNANGTADKISLNKKYYGNFHASDDVDYYKVTVDAAGKLKVKLAPDKTTDSDKVRDGWAVSVYKGSNSKDLVALTDITKAKSKTINVTKGTYYIKVTSDFSWSQPVECTYNLTASYCKNPSKATLSSVTAGKKNATVKWKKVSNATGYEVYRSTSKNSGYKKVTTIKKNSTLKYTNKSLKSGKTYYYKVRAYKTANGITAYGSYSAVKKVKVK